jgi:structural maintenance of chromosomes protein 6
MKQFGELAKRIETVNAEQRPIMEERQKVKAQIDTHDEQRSALLAATQDAVEKRLRAQNEKSHYARKLEEEQAKVDSANEAVEQVQEEFKVRGEDSMMLIC